VSSPETPVLRAQTEPLHSDQQTRADERRRQRRRRTQRSSDARIVARFTGLIVALVVLLLASVTFGVTIGVASIAPVTVWAIIPEHFGLPVEQTWTQSVENIVWVIRLPRVLLGGIVGAGLAVVGVVIQALVRNALADPYVLGVTSGASVGASVVILFGGFGVLGGYAMSGAAFLGALGAVVIVFFVAQRRGRLSPLRLVLGGVATAYVLSAVTSFLTFQARDSDAVRAVLFWLLGSLSSARWSYLTAPIVVLAVATALMFARARFLNALVMGDDTAATLGVSAQQVRREMFVVVSLLTGVLVAVSGGIGFVGLMIPHVVRLIVGPDHRRVLPVAALLGASFLIWADVGARTLFAPEELPIGVITALIGGPVFVLLMRSERYGLRADR